MAFSRNKRTVAARALSVDEALLKMENFCAYRERCPKEVRDKILALGLKGGDAEQVYLSLEADRFFDEKRFALAFAGGKFRYNQWGKVRIRQELKLREIDSDLIREALDSIEEADYEETLRNLISRRMDRYSGDENARDKTIAALVRAGYELGLVFKLLGE